MQKFLRLLIILFLFIICLLIGANLANVTLPDNDNRTNLAEVEGTQTQILLFIVDNFENRKPQLQSIWSVILYYQDSKGIMIIPLTDRTKPNFEELEKSFILTPEKDLSERTVKYFNTKFKTKWNSTIVVDEIGLPHLLNWVSNGQINVPGEDFSLEHGHIDVICSSISNKVPSFENLNWSPLSPNHFKSNLNIDQMKSIWSNFDQSTSLMCEIIVD